MTETIRAKRGDLFTIELSSNPSTGFCWEPSYDDDLLRLMDHSFKSRSHLIGAWGTESFTFQVLEEGEVLMRYRRPWEEEDADVRRFRVLLI